MKKISGVLLFALIVTLGCNAYQWNASKEVKRHAFGRNITFIGSDLIVVKNSLEPLASGLSSDRFYLGYAFHALVDAGRRANGLSAEPSWYKIYASFDQASVVLQQVIDKETVTEQDRAQIQRIQALAGGIFEAIKGSNPNTGYVEDRALKQAAKAAVQFIESLQ